MLEVIEKYIDDYLEPKKEGRMKWILFSFVLNACTATFEHKSENQVKWKERKCVLENVTGKIEIKADGKLIVNGREINCGETK